MHLLSALDTSTGIVLAQVTVDAKSTEIPAFTPLLDAVKKALGSLVGVLFVADAQPSDLQKWARSEWLIENQVHNVRDVTFREDLHQARTGTGPAVMVSDELRVLVRSQGQIDR